MQLPVKTADFGKPSFLFLLLGIILLGLGFLGFKLFTFDSGPRVEILGEAQEETTAEGGKITVEASGEVIKPGVYELPEGSRVNDLLVTAGGLSAMADRDWVTKNLNLAQKLADGTKIYVPNKSIRVEDPASGGVKQGSKININAASESELDRLWGVGPATAQKIISGRPYLRIEELLEKKIVKSNVWEAIKDKISLY